MSGAQDPALFIGSSKEGIDVARELQTALEEDCESTIWDQGAFGLSGTSIGSLVQAARIADFAVFVLSADDLVTKRGETMAATRDNIIFEAGLFIGAIGLERTFLLSCRSDDLTLPSDLDGVTRATYKQRPDGNLRAALGPPSQRIRESIKALGVRHGGGAAPAAPAVSHQTSTSIADQAKLLDRELDSLTTSAEAQGWHLKTRSSNAYRVIAPDGRRFSLSLGAPRETRMALRPYAQELSENGMRLSRHLITPVDEVPDSSGTRPVDRGDGNG